MGWTCWGAPGSSWPVLALDLFGGLNVHFFLGVLASISGLFLAMKWYTEKESENSGSFQFRLLFMPVGGEPDGCLSPGDPGGRKPGKGDSSSPLGTLF